MPPQSHEWDSASPSESPIGVIELVPTASGETGSARARGEQARRSNVSLALLRVGVGVVFVVFGIQKVLAPQPWSHFIPREWIAMLEQATRLSIHDAIRLHGVLEAVLGVQLLIGLWTRATAACCALTLAVVLVAVGLSGIGIRDLGLFFASLALSVGGAGAWSVDARIAGLRAIPKGRSNR